ncbi:alkaline phosphatase [Agarivorans sp. TSD2052]|uniref:alkaline phosphatase n=1 Tax=Agarivorans sp. TSD2052 TaxID=2937286 RepID=UPI00200CC695|nr:alkaline phosphatase [Agarivorans sp. TSD2052]UPW17455.1 alkaline phosphatase [Agarivorans sp. TSD2052]
MKRMVTASAAAISVILASASHAAALPEYQTNSAWYSQAATVVSDRATTSTASTTAKNVIVFVGDGMGISTQTAARILEGQSKVDNQGGEENYLSFETFPHTALAKTYNTDQQTPDSAGTMTAMMSGAKTKAGMIGVSDNINRGDCEVSHERLLTALELATLQNKATGVVSTARITHATPAATYAHISDRNWEASVPEECEGKVSDIAYQLIHQAADINVIMGGGRRNFIPDSVEGPEGSNGRRTDGNNLIEDWQSFNSKGQYVWNSEGFNAIDTHTTSKVLGLFNSSHMEYEADRDDADEPSLSAMTEKAIEVLLNANSQQDQQGFFLVVESGRIDHAHHGGNAARSLQDTIEYSNAVTSAIETLTAAGELDDTLIIVTADHSHVFTMAGYPKRGNPILGLVVGVGSDDPSLANDDKPYTTLGYANGPGVGASFDAGVRGDLSALNTSAIDYQQQALVPTSSETHAGEDVAVFAMGPQSYLIQGAIEQSVIFHAINQAASLGGNAYVGKE